MKDTIMKICNIVKRFDSAAAEYILKRYKENTLLTHLSTFDDEFAIAHLFTWIDTPQGEFYWFQIHTTYKKVFKKKFTPKGNVL